MEKSNPPRILIGGTNSGCGKTTITCALLSALVKRGLDASSFKCGPDYIDPMFHSKIIGTESYNLDSFFYTQDVLKQLLCENSKEISVIEGVMGFFDGMSVNSMENSSYTVAKTTGTPVILVVNCKGMAYSILPMIEGFVNHKTDFILAGVILNNIAATTYESIKKLGESYFSNRVKFLGYMPKLPADLVIESRHLGLVTADEIVDIKSKLASLGEIAEQTIEIDNIIKIARTSESLNYTPLEYKKVCGQINIGVALDNAFCFYYKDNLKLLEKMGANLIYFSPVSDEKVPDNINGLYLGGGYPELYLEKLEANVTMRESIYKFLQDKKPCIAECGGFMYLTQMIDDKKMVAWLDGTCHNTKKLSRFGYASFTASKDCILMKDGESFKGHEFHYYDCTNNGEDFTAVKPNGKSWLCGHGTDHLYAGFSHISFYSNTKLVKDFLEKCSGQK